ncbi:hypothetical protein C6P45_000294 [Maudiozyma exigua]|uniref:Something about silencing protein 4 domain-containing protein n=1 Tax=Maudiozyma exigua TaxID=34358 RepID=A0A9P7B9S9_MAUEX|nr:hypothetical protein C6P45_000294 [Kazachstania exigua]
MEDIADFKSRSTRSASNLGAADSNIYEFDFSYTTLDPDLQLNCVPRSNVKKSDDVSSRENIQNTRTSINKMVLNIEHNELIVRQKKKLELRSLPDSIYEQFHKKMLRQELKMIEADVKEGYDSAEHLEQLYNKLEVVTWPMALQKMTKINNPTDDEELNLKKKMTMEKIMSMLDKYKLMTEHATILKKPKSRLKINPLSNYNKIYRNIDRMFIENYESSSDEEEEDLNVEQIRKHRLKKRSQICGGTITIGLKTFGPSESFAIIAEPLKNPYVIKLTGKEKRELAKIEPQRRVFKYSRYSKNIATLKSKRTIPLTMKFDAIEREKLIKEYNDTQLEDTEETHSPKSEIGKDDNSQIKSLELINRIENANNNVEPPIFEVLKPESLKVEQCTRFAQPMFQQNMHTMQPVQILNGNISQQHQIFNKANVSQPNMVIDQNRMIKQNRATHQNMLVNRVTTQNNVKEQNKFNKQSQFSNEDSTMQRTQMGKQYSIIQQDMQANTNRLSHISPIHANTYHQLTDVLSNPAPLPMIGQFKPSIPVLGQTAFPIEQLHQPIVSHGHGNITTTFMNNSPQIIPQKRSAEAYAEPTILIPHKKKQD